MEAEGRAVRRARSECCVRSNRRCALTRCSTENPRHQILERGAAHHPFDMAGERNAARAAGDHLLLRAPPQRRRHERPGAAKTMLRIAETAPVPPAAPLRTAAPQPQRIAIKPERHAVRGVDLGLALLVSCAACDNCLSRISVCYAMWAWWFSVLSSSRPATAGRGDHPWRVARRMVGGARAATLLLRRQRSVASEAPSTAQTRVPLPRFRGGGCTLLRSRERMRASVVEQRCQERRAPIRSPHERSDMRVRTRGR